MVGREKIVGKDGINCVQCWKISEICKETEKQRAKC